MTKYDGHTPRPWKVKHTIGAPEIVSNTRRVAIALYDGGSEDNQVDANARLMAAAPSLLEASQLVMQATGGGRHLARFLNDDTGKLGVYLSPSELRTIITAIADATQEAPDADTG